jgi:hypothetical protein
LCTVPLPLILLFAGKVNSAMLQRPSVDRSGDLEALLCPKIEKSRIDGQKGGLQTARHFQPAPAFLPT